MWAPGGRGLRIVRSLAHEWGVIEEPHGRTVLGLARRPLPPPLALSPRPCAVLLPDPALVVLVGASGSGKSTWAAARYRAAEVVSSDALRGVVGSGEHDLDASADAFALLEQVVVGPRSAGA